MIFKNKVYLSLYVSQSYNENETIQIDGLCKNQDNYWAK